MATKGTAKALRLSTKWMHWETPLQSYYSTSFDFSRNKISKYENFMLRESARHEVITLSNQNCRSRDSDFVLTSIQNCSTAPISTNFHREKSQPLAGTNQMKSKINQRVGLSRTKILLTLLIIVFGLTVWVLPTSAQTWDTGNGNWNMAGNWSPNVVPNSSTADVVINTGNNVTVSLNINAVIRDLLLGSGDTLNINSGQSLNVHGNLTNNGLLVVNPLSGASTTILQFNEDAVISGSGRIQLGRAGTLAQITTAAGNTITQQSGHTIEGVGNIAASLINQGVVRADASLGMGSELNLLTNNKTNSNLFEAVTNSTLNISGIAVNNAGGIIRASGADSVVQLSGTMSIAGGTLETTNGGLFQTSGAGTKTLTDVVNLGTLHVSNGTILEAAGTLTNQGQIAINPTAGASTTIFRATDNLILAGNGNIQLGRSGTLAQITTVADKTITQQAGHTIQGVGNVTASLINQGVVRADASLGTGSELTLLTNGMTNTNLFESVNNSTLNISGIAINNAGGTIRASGVNSVVQLSGTMSISGGILEATNGGLFQTSGAGSKTLTNVLSLGTLHVSNGTTLEAAGTLTNQEQIVINPTAGSSSTLLRASDDLILAGNGSIQLGRVGSLAQITTAADKTITQEAGHTIQGVGNLAARLTNQGVVRADASLGFGSELALLTNNKINTNLFEAVSDSLLDINGIAINNAGGIIRASGANSVVQLSGTMSIAGGILETANGGSFQTSGAGSKTLTNVVNLGTLNVSNGTTLEAAGTLTNQGQVVVNPTAGPSSTLFRASDDLILAGNGSIQLGRSGTLAQVTTAADKTITQQAGHTIQGVGNISASLVNHGLVRADATIGTGTELHLLTNSKTNSGVFSAANGGILRVDNGLLSNWNPGTQTLSGGTYEVIGDSTMRLVGANVQTLNAHVRLDGADSKLFSTAATTTNALANLDTIDSAGQLTLLNGRQLTTSGALSMLGMVGVDGAGSQLTVVGDFHQTAGMTRLANGATVALQGANNLFSGGVLVGDGTIDGSFALSSNAVLSPGFSAGQIDVLGNFTWGAGGILEFDLGADPFSTDFLNISGNLLKSGAGNWAFSFADNGMIVGNTYDLIAFTGTTDFDLNDFSFTNPLPFEGAFQFGNGGQTLQFTLTAVPEPGTGFLFLMVTLGTLMVRHRKFEKAGH
jgi:hypothetical protein